MNDRPAQPDRLSPEQRDDLAFAAARAERRNRPAHWLALATLLFAAALISLAWSGWNIRAAEKRLSDQRSIAAQTAELAGQITRLRERAAGAAGAGENQPISQIRSRLQQIGAEAGVTGTIPVPIDETERFGTSVRRKFRFANVQDDSLPALLSWLDRAVDELPGVEVYSVTIRPQANQWQVSVTFARWERAG